MGIINRPKYCENCGRKLVEKEIFEKYDSFDGHKVFSLYLRCPKYKESWFPPHCNLYIDTI